MASKFGSSTTVSLVDFLCILQELLIVRQKNGELITHFSHGWIKNIQAKNKAILRDN